MLGLMTAKPVVYVCNVEEASAANGNDYSRKVEARAKEEGAVVGRDLREDRIRNRRAARATSARIISPRSA